MAEASHWKTGFKKDKTGKGKCLADGLSTSLFVLGTEDAIAYCEEHCAEDGFDAIMEDEDGKLYITDGIMDDFINMNNTANIQEIKTK